MLLPLALTPTAVADTATTTPFSATFAGTFTLTFGADYSELRFSGTGTGTNVGLTSITGHSKVRPDGADGAEDGCSALFQDSVTLTASDGSALYLVNEAVDCVDWPHISGSGTYTVVSGSDRLEGAAGHGRVSTAAVITGHLPDGSGVTGTFDPLRAEGELRH